MLQRRPHRYPYLGARVLAPVHYGNGGLLRLFPAVVTCVRPDNSVDLMVFMAGEKVGASPGFIAAADWDDSRELTPGTWRWPPHGE